MFPLSLLTAESRVFSIFFFSVDDVENGICLYETAGSGTALLQANITHIEDVKSGMAPYGQVYKRCADQNNYDEDVGLCTCTPNCGSCAADTEEYHDGDLSGAACLDLNELLERKLADNRATLCLLEVSSRGVHTPTHLSVGSVVPIVRTNVEASMTPFRLISLSLHSLW